MNFSLKKSMVAYAVASVLGVTIIAVPAGADPPPTPSLATVATALGASGADAGSAINWNSSDSSPVTEYNNGMTVSLPETADGQVSLSRNGVSIGIGIPYGQGAANGQNIGNATTVYSGGAPKVAVAAQADTTGAREAITITGSNAPTTYAFPLTVPAGASLVPDSNGDGGYSIQSTPSNGVTIQYGKIGAPWAKDANGNPVPTSYSIQGNTLIQTVNFTNSTAFPVVADPMLTLGWYLYLYFSGSNIHSFETAYGGQIQGMTYYAIGSALCYFTGAGTVAFLCGAAATVAGTAFNDLLLRAYGRNHGGIVFEFNYVGVISPADSYAGYQFVGSWSGVNLL